MARIKQLLGLLALLVAVASVCAQSASAAAGSTVKAKADWQAAIARVPELGTGCYHASYPTLRWHAVACVRAPKWPLEPTQASPSTDRAAPMIVGGGDDYAAEVSGLISGATASFNDVSPGVTERGEVDGQGPEVANAFSLQLNTEFFSTPACSASGDPSNCLGWQQFVYTLSGGTGYVFMQYWLINYDATCPSGWYAYAADCYVNSAASSLPAGPLTAAGLANVKLSASAASGGNDEVALSGGSGDATLVTKADSQLDLSRAWNATEWGVFGDGGGGEAYFGADTTLEPQTSLTATRSAAPRCLSEGFTAETNNLKLARSPALPTEPSPTMASRQTNGAGGTPSCAVSTKRVASKTALSLSATSVTYGSEQKLKFTAKVSPDSPARPTGTVRISSGSAKLCTITLSAGTGRCSPKSAALAAGKHTIVAVYGGDGNFLGSSSPGEQLTVKP